MNCSTLFVLLLCFCFVGAFRLPPFMENAPEDVKQKYTNIVTNDADPEEKQTEIEKLMESQSEDLKQAYSDFKDQMNEIKVRFSNSVGDEIKNLKSKVSFA